MKITIPLRCLVISLFTLTICCCDPDPTPTEEPRPDVGDTQTRPNDGMTMVYVPAGEFLMGSSDQAVEETLAQCEKYLIQQRCRFSLRGASLSLNRDIDPSRLRNYNQLSKEPVLSGFAEPPLTGHRPYI